MNNEKVAIPELDSMKELPDLCANRDIRAEVKDLYYRYRGRCESFLLPLLGRGCDDAPKYYVYAWYAKTEPKKYFYVGKGTAMRYKHILKEIESVEQRKKHNERYTHMLWIKNESGIDCDIVLDHLTEYEAYIYEECLKLFLVDNGEYLLCEEGGAYNMQPGEWAKELEDEDGPILGNSPFRRRYLHDPDLPHFDGITPEILKAVWFYPYFVKENAINENEKWEIINWIEASGGKVLENRPSKNRSIIIQGKLYEDTYRTFRKNNTMIISSKDLIDYIRAHPISTNNGTIGETKRRLEETKKRNNIAANAIIDHLLQAGADQNGIETLSYNNEVVVHYLNRSVYCTCLKRSPRYWISVPLDIADGIENQLVDVDSWHGKYRFDSLDDLDQIEQFFINLVKSAIVEEYRVLRNTAE